MNNLRNTLRSLPNQASQIPRNVRLMMITVLAYGIAVEGIFVVLLNLYLLRLGYGTEFIGTINSVGLFVFAIISLPIGAVQRFSSRQMIQIGQVISAVGLVGLAMAQYATTWQATLLILFRIISMVGLSCYFVHQLPFAMAITKPAWHSRVMSLTMATFSMAAFIGSWFGGMLPELFGRWLNVPLSDPTPYQLPMLVATVMLIPAMFAIHRIPEKIDVEDEAERLKNSAETTPPLNWRSMVGLVAIILVVRALQTSSVGVTLTFSNVYFDDALNISTSRIGLISGLGRLIGVPMSLTIPWLVNRFGNFRLVHISLALIVLLSLPLALIPQWQVAAVALISINMMSSLRYLSFIAFTMALVPESQRSLMSGAGEMAIGAGFAISSFVGGYLIAWYGYRELFLFGATLTTIGTVAFWLIFRKRAAKMAAIAPATVH